MPKEVLRHLNKIYAKNAGSYEKLSLCEDCNNDIIRTITKDIDFNDKVILDLGAGTGRFAVPLAKKAGFIYALDNCRPMLTVFRRKLREKRIKNVRLLEAGYQKIPLPKESVDIVLSIWSFPAHSDNWERDLKEIKRVLREDGRIILVDNHFSGEYYRIKRKVNESKLFSSIDKFLKEEHEWLKSRGFRNKVISTTLNFKTKRNIEKACRPFFGAEVAFFLLSRGKLKVEHNLSVFYGKKGP